MNRLHRVSLPLLVTLTVFAVSLGGCNSQKNADIDLQPDSEQSGEGSQVAKSSGQTPGGIADTLRSQADMENPDIKPDALPENMDELMASLARKQAEQNRVTDPKDFYQIQQYRAAASEKLLAMKLSEDQRFEFIKIRLDSLLKLVSIGDPQAEHEFQEFIVANQQHSQSRVRQAVAVAGLIHDYHERVAERSTDMQPVVDAAASIAGEFPDSFDVCKELGGVVIQMLQQNDRESAKRLSWVLINTYQNSASETARGYVKRLEGQVRIASANLDSIVKEIRDQRPDSFDRYREAISYLLADENLNLSVTEPIIASLQWLERTGLIEETIEANRIVNAASIGIQQRPIRERIRQNCSRRDTRLGFVGQPFSISGQSADGTTFDWTAFSRERPVVVVFWSPTNPSSVRLVRQLAETPDIQQENGAKLLAISTTSNADASQLFEEPGANVMVLTASADDGPDGIREAFGVEQLPQIFLVDRMGHVATVNPPANALRSRITDLAKQ